MPWSVLFSSNVHAIPLIGPILLFQVYTLQVSPSGYRQLHRWLSSTSQR